MSRAFGRLLRVLAGVGCAGLLMPGTTPAQADAKPTYVAVVIAGHGTGCVRWHSGITGDDVLNNVASVRYRRDGVIVQIDGAPGSGTADDTHYWSYWHHAGHGWTYSDVGAGGYQPAAGAVEGWSYDDGHANPPPPPASSYAGSCGARDPRPAPRPAPSATHRASLHGTPAGVRHPGSASQPRTSAAHSPATLTPTRTVASGVRAHSASSRRTSRRAPSIVAGTTASTISPSPVSGTVTLTPLTKPVDRASGGGSPLPAVLGLGLVAAIGAAGAFTASRRRASR